jgi:hypothetical protein
MLFLSLVKIRSGGLIVSAFERVFKKTHIGQSVDFSFQSLDISSLIVCQAISVYLPCDLSVILFSLLHDPRDTRLNSRALVPLYSATYSPCGAYFLLL